MASPPAPAATAPGPTAAAPLPVTMAVYWAAFSLPSCFQHVQQGLRLAHHLAVAGGGAALHLFLHHPLPALRVRLRFQLADGGRQVCLSTELADEQILEPGVGVLDGLTRDVLGGGCRTGNQCTDDD